MSCQEQSAWFNNNPYIFGDEDGERSWFYENPDLREIETYLRHFFDNAGADLSFERTHDESFESDVEYGLASSVSNFAIAYVLNARREESLT